MVDDCGARENGGDDEHHEDASSATMIMSVIFMYISLTLKSGQYVYLDP